MRINVLLDPADAPTLERVHTALGPSATWYDQLLTLTQGYQHDWKHYGAKYGWKLKIHADAKTLAEVTIADGWLLVSLALRAPEHEALRRGPTAPVMAALLDGEAGAPEGYGLKIDVRDAASWQQLNLLLEPVLALRSRT